MSDSQSDHDSDCSSVVDENRDPVHSVQELVDIFLDFYQFLQTIHYNEATLKIPPPEGWSDDVLRLPSHIREAKSDLALEVMRRLPYFEEDSPDAFVHYNSRLLDLTSLSEEIIDGHFEFLIDVGLFSSYTGKEINNADGFPFAHGWESGGVYLFLDVRDGEVHREDVRMGFGEAEDAKRFFQQLKDDFSSLKIIPCSIRTVMIAQDVPENSKRITEDEVIEQQEYWGTHLDVQYIRQVYRDHGWPHAFRKKEAFEAVDQLMNKMGDHRGEWGLTNIGHVPC